MRQSVNRVAKVRNPTHAQTMKNERREPSELVDDEARLADPDSLPRAEGRTSPIYQAAGNPEPSRNLYRSRCHRSPRAVNRADRLSRSRLRVVYSTNKEDIEIGEYDVEQLAPSP
jgi:hypothetical protein